MSANGLVDRRRIIDAVERQVRKMGAWEPSDDLDSQSSDRKPIGRANIDYAISQLKREGRLDNPTRGRWRIPVDAA
jgi:hypothetical protein